MLIRLFGAQEKLVFDNLLIHTNIERILFEKSEQDQALATTARERYEEILRTHGNEVLAELGVGMAFDLISPVVSQWLAEKPFKFADQVNTTTLDSLRKALTEGIQAGENIESLRKRVQTVFDGTVRGQAWRSRMIARTETISSFNFSALQGYHQSQVVGQKEWLTALDERVRPTHRAANRQVRKLDEAFDVGGYPLMYPGDGEHGSAGEVVNCRCTLLPILAPV